MARFSSVSAVVPVYNSEGSLEELSVRLEAVLSAVCERWEVLLVNDGSRDGSWDVIQRLAGKYPWLRGIDLMRNYGQHNALLAGIRAARYPVTVTLDDDLQHPPEEIPRLLARLEEGCDVVYGTPEHEHYGLLRGAATYVTKLALQGAMGATTARQISAFRAFRTELRAAFDGYESAYVSIDVLLTWGTARFGVVRVRHEPRRIGVSNYTFAKLMTHALNLMTGFSVLPLRLAGWIGFGLAFFGVVVLLFVIGRYVIEGASVPGFPFLASIIAIFSGAQLFALGIIGEYLARMHFRMMNRPPYVVRREQG